MKYPLFIKGKSTGQAYIRGEVYKKHNFAVYYHFKALDQYTNPLLTDESENWKLWSKTSFNLKQLLYMVCFKIIHSIHMIRFQVTWSTYKTICNLLRPLTNDHIKLLEERIAHQRRIFYSVPQPSILKAKFEYLPSKDTK